MLLSKHIHLYKYKNTNSKLNSIKYLSSSIHLIYVRSILHNLNPNNDLNLVARGIRLRSRIETDEFETNTLERDTFVERILFVTAAQGEQLLSSQEWLAITLIRWRMAIALIRINLPSVSIELIPVDKYV